MKEMIIIESLAEQGFNAGFADKMLVVTVENKGDVHKVIENRSEQDPKVPVFIKFRDGSAPVYYGMVKTYAALKNKFGGTADAFRWNGDNKMDFEEVEDYLRELHKY